MTHNQVLQCHKSFFYRSIEEQKFETLKHEYDTPGRETIPMSSLT